MQGLNYTPALLCMEKKTISMGRNCRNATLRPQAKSLHFF